MPDDDNAHERTAPGRRCLCGDRLTGEDRQGLFRSGGQHGRPYKYPDTRRRSNASSDSWSMARPERSGILVNSSSAMISSMVPAFEATGKVMSASPSER